MTEIRGKKIAVDFDGFLCDDKYPEIGEARTDGIACVQKLKVHGNKIILWTCRKDERLKEAVDWCAERGIIFDAVNENLPEVIEKYGGDTRKIHADYYLDDKNAILGSRLLARDVYVIAPANGRMTMKNEL